jgi:hypothetical protein
MTSRSIKQALQCRTSYVILQKWFILVQSPPVDLNSELWTKLRILGGKHCFVTPSIEDPEFTLNSQNSNRGRNRIKGLSPCFSQLLQSKI